MPGRWRCRSREAVSRPIRELGDLERAGGSIEATCRKCKRAGLFAVSDLLAHFRRRKWDASWPAGVATKLRCEACGSRFPDIAWSVVPSPPTQPPPRPRSVREPPMPVPLGVDPEEWEKAQTDRDRRRLIRIARD